MADTPLILLHGALGAAPQMDELRQLLSEKFHAVYAFPFSGHGGSPLPAAPFTIEGFAEEVKRWMEAQQIRQADFFGYSMGGYVALALALQAPEKVGRITTLGTKFGWTPESAAKEAAMLNPEKWLEKIPAFAAAIEQRHAPADWKALVRKTAEMMLALGNGRALTAEQLAAVEAPVTIGVGALDHMVSREESEWAALHLKQARLVILPDTKHPFEQVDTVQLAAYIGAQHGF